MGTAQYSGSTEKNNFINGIGAMGAGSFISSKNVAVNTNLLIGKVRVVSMSRMEVIAVPESTTMGRVKDYVIVVVGGLLVFGQVDGIHEALVNGERVLTYTVKPRTTVDLQKREVTEGIIAYPSIGDAVYLADSQIVQFVMQHDRHIQDEEPLLISLAALNDEKKTPLFFSPERIMGVHCAILGTTGGGKSWTLARLVEQCGKLNSKVILFDSTGEFSTQEENTFHVHIGPIPDRNTNSREVAVPYSDLTENDLFAIFKPAGESQAPKLKAAMRSLKLARLAPEIALDGLIVKAFKQKTHYLDKLHKHIDEVENPYAVFDIKNLTKQIENECINPQRSVNEPLVWGGVNNNDYSCCVPLINRIEDIINSHALSCVFKPGKKPSIFRVISKFLRDPSLNVLRISLEHLPFTYNVREIIVNAVGRYLLSVARKGQFHEMPLTVFVDEAHHFLNNVIEDGVSQYTLDSFSLIAKEGRKYSLTACLATQRPRDIPEDVLSQMGTFIVHRLINDLDRAVIERASGSAESSVLAAISGLVPGEAVAMGTDFKLPVYLKIHPPEQKPVSRGANYQRYWR